MDKAQQDANNRIKEVVSANQKNNKGEGYLIYIPYYIASPSIKKFTYFNRKKNKYIYLDAYYSAAEMSEFLRLRNYNLSIIDSKLLNNTDAQTFLAEENDDYFPFVQYDPVYKSFFLWYPDGSHNAIAYMRIKPTTYYYFTNVIENIILNAPDQEQMNGWIKLLKYHKKKGYGVRYDANTKEWIAYYVGKDILNNNIHNLKKIINVKDVVNVGKSKGENQSKGSTEGSTKFNGTSYNTPPKKSNTYNQQNKYSIYDGPIDYIAQSTREIFTYNLMKYIKPIPIGISEFNYYRKDFEDKLNTWYLVKKSADSVIDVLNRLLRDIDRPFSGVVDKKHWITIINIAKKKYENISRSKSQYKSQPKEQSTSEKEEGPVIHPSSHGKPSQDIPSTQKEEVTNTPNSEVGENRNKHEQLMGNDDLVYENIYFNIEKFERNGANTTFLNTLRNQINNLSQQNKLNAKSIHTLLTKNENNVNYTKELVRIIAKDFNSYSYKFSHKIDDILEDTNFDYFSYGAFEVVFQMLYSLNIPKKYINGDLDSDEEQFYMDNITYTLIGGLADTLLRTKFDMGTTYGQLVSKKEENQSKKIEILKNYFKRTTSKYENGNVLDSFLFCILYSKSLDYLELNYANVVRKAWYEANNPDNPLTPDVVATLPMYVIGSHFSMPNFHLIKNNEYGSMQEKKGATERDITKWALRGIIMGYVLAGRAYKSKKDTEHPGTNPIYCNILNKNNHKFVNFENRQIDYSDVESGFNYLYMLFLMGVYNTISLKKDNVDKLTQALYNHVVDNELITNMMV